jgi:drug/metabolite transporter (DMT)-like permease
MTRRGWLLFSAMCVLWGMPYLLIKIAVEELSPPSWSCCGPGSPRCCCCRTPCGRARWALPCRHWKPVLAFTALELTIPWFLLASAETQLSSSLTGLLVAAVPLVGAFVARVVDHGERLSRIRSVGLALGFAGVGALVGFDVRGGDLLSVAEVAVVVVCYATGPADRQPLPVRRAATGVTAVSLAVTALIYLPFGAPGLEVPSGRVVLAGLVLTAGLHRGRACSPSSRSSPRPDRSARWSSPSSTRPSPGARHLAAVRAADARRAGRACRSSWPAAPSRPGPPSPPLPTTTCGPRPVVRS